MLSGKAESVNERTHTDQQKIKFNTLWVRQKCQWINYAIG